MSMRREDLTGTWAMHRKAQWPSKRHKELARQALEFGLESAGSPAIETSHLDRQ